LASVALNHCYLARYVAAALTSHLLENKSKTYQVNLKNPPLIKCKGSDYFVKNTQSQRLFIDLFFVKKGNIVALGVKKGAFLGGSTMRLKYITYICKEFKK